MVSVVVIHKKVSIDKERNTVLEKKSIFTNVHKNYDEAQRQPIW